jgi:hypothetical protein
MAEQTKRGVVRKGRIYQIRIAAVEYRFFIWEMGSGFCGRIEDHPQVLPCRGRTVVHVRDQLCAAMTASLAV